ncbi:hypothetical protein A1j_00048 [Klebsiella phage VLCpiA1j]|nr:hypothetical protein A1j_00048 [Klebsiella phage VLCpiA1j]
MVEVGKQYKLLHSEMRPDLVGTYVTVTSTEVVSEWLLDFTDDYSRPVVAIAEDPDFKPNLHNLEV